MLQKNEGQGDPRSQRPAQQSPGYEVPPALTQFMDYFNKSAKNPTSPEQQEEQKQQKILARAQVLKLDYKLLQKYPIVSMFVLPASPQSDSGLSRWHGVYFVKQGIYQGAILKFQLDFPINYPFNRPRVHFLNPQHIYHPLVHPKTGEINLVYEFPEWKPGKHWAVNILLSIKKMLHLHNYYSLKNLDSTGEDIEQDAQSDQNQEQASPRRCQVAFNKEAHQDFINSFEDVFIEKCKVAIQQSQEDKHKEIEQKSGQDTLMKFSEYDPVHDTVAEKVNQCVDSIAIDRELEMEDEDTIIERKKEEVKKWFVNNYATELNQRANTNATNQNNYNTNDENANGQMDVSFHNLVSIAQQIDSHSSQK